MEEKTNSKKKTLLLSLAALAVVALLVFLIVRSSEKSRHEAIVLPDAPAPVQQQSPAPEQTEPAQLEVREDNIQKILKSLSRPSAYHQTLRISQFVDEKQYDQQTELWVNGELLRADFYSDAETRTILTDGRTLYLWYDDSETVAEISLDGSISMDDLLGIPTYESILALDASDIRQADFVTSEDTDGSCVYVLSETDGIERSFWVSLDSGLLLRSQESKAGVQLYEMEQQTLELLGNADEVFSDVFVLPDSTEPFSEK